MDILGQLNFDGATTNLTKKLVNIVCTSKPENSDAKRNDLGFTKGDLEWMKSKCGVLNTDNDRLQLWLCLQDDIDTVENAELIKLPVPVVYLPHNSGVARIIIGHYLHQYSPIQADLIDFWDIRLKPNHAITFEKLEKQSVALFVFSGEIVLKDRKKLTTGELGFFHQKGSTLTINSLSFANVVFLRGSLIDEPLVGHGKINLRTLLKVK